MKVTRIKKKPKAQDRVQRLFGTPVEYDAKDITQVLRHEGTKARRILGTDFADYTDQESKEKKEGFLPQITRILRIVKCWKDRVPSKGIITSASEILASGL
jgi:hypothetical protein